MMSTRAMGIEYWSKWRAFKVDKGKLLHVVCSCWKCHDVGADNLGFTLFGMFRDAHFSS